MTYRVCAAKRYITSKSITSSSESLSAAKANYILNDGVWCQGLENFVVVDTLHQKG